VPNLIEFSIRYYQVERALAPVREIVRIDYRPGHAFKIGSHNDPHAAAMKVLRQ
jgi:hypothetical protein